MNKINTNTLSEHAWESPKGNFKAASKNVSIELGRDPKSMDLMKRHPFDVEILRIPPGAIPYPFHSHSAQWEFYHVISGSGKVRDDDGWNEVEAGDAFIYKPGENHQLQNDSDRDLILYVIADNPIGESCYYPDSNKWNVPLPTRRCLRSETIDYFDREE
ncbi:cupin domain-containing protein [Puniceicoccales bacterium CK1056]|uniref:Cupin domain-containing protein n=1 Tax=Oceanipulchritudo coccoides TaxID=2706888 RepID=A0A6B2M1D5_9BACT|nr:cupin domain-containing protein [Oceanipulchritudo coccoides]NDV61944.1 cupin domain-containing protein [Oceanipulchritudo coccoides]